MKFLYFTDFHIRSSSPKRRTDDIMAAGLRKLTWIVNRANELKVTAVLFGGDLGEFYKWDSTLIARVTKVLEKLNCVFLATIGNHDIPGDNSLLVEETGMGVLEKALENFHILNAWDGWAFGKVTIASYPYGQQRTTDFLENNPRTYSDALSGNGIALIHADVGPGESPYWRDYKTVDVPAKFACFGHVHEGWPPFKTKSGGTLINTGCVLRQKINEVRFVPKIAIIDVDSGVVYEEIPHQPAEEIFDLPKVKQASDIGVKYASQLNTIEFSIHDPKKQIDEVGQELKFSKESIQKLRELI
jgi:exonuclease SbcD